MINIRKASKCVGIILLSFMMCGMTLVDEGYKFTEKRINETKSYGTIDIKIPIIVGSDNSNVKEFNGIVGGDIADWQKDLVELAKQDEAESKSKGIDFRPDYYQYTGGAHGLTTRNTYNYDFNQGKRLRLFELFKEGYDYQTKINDIIRQQIAKNPSEYFQDENGFKGIKNKQDFYIDKDGIVIVFQLYDIAPYASGIKEFHIPFSAVQDGLLYKFK